MGRNERQSETWLYGKHVIETMLSTSPHRIGKLYCSKMHNSQHWQEASARHGIPLQLVAVDFFSKILGDVHHQGIAANCRPFAYHSFEALCQQALNTPHPCLIALDQVQDSNNVGSIARSALALGASGLVLPKDRTCSITPQVEKVAAGALSRLPVAQVVNLARMLEQAHQAGFWCIGLDMAETGQSLADCRWDMPVVLVLGAEEKGLRPLVRSVCQVMAKIPMVGPMESLNVAVSASIALYERLRGRS